MILVAFLTFLVLFISSVVMILASLLSKKTVMDREKNSPYECGFDPKGTARLPFSLRFFLIAVIFLIFDVEITLILPVPYILELSNVFYWSSISLYFIMILLFGLYFEWYQGALEWSE